jgi:hypothetical protein
MKYDPQQIRFEASKTVAKISLDALNATDCLSIKTADNTYVFVVTDPEERRGLLTGGELGSSSAASVLLGADTRQNGQVSALFSGLYQGSRAIFFVESRDGVRQVITSEITGLIHIEANNARRKSTGYSTNSLADSTKAETDGRC